MTFFHTLPGMYILQTVLHSFTALIIVELSLFAWDIKDHFSIFRYRLLTLTLPIFMFPLYQILSPDRGTWHFRLTTALFDSHRWIDLKVLNFYPVALILLAVLVGFSTVFLLQEILPIFRRRGNQHVTEHTEVTEGREDVRRILESVCSQLGTEVPEVTVIETDDPVLFTQGYKKHSIIISSGLFRKLDRKQLGSALTHEVVHMKRSSNFKTQLIYMFRMMMFFNPVSLVEFRRIVHDDEFICDDITVSITKDPQSLISALSTFFYHPEELSAGLSRIKEQVESHSHNLLLHERIRKLTESSCQQSSGFIWPQFLLTLSAILLIGYGVV